MQAAARARGVLLAALLAVAGACGGGEATPAGGGAASPPAPESAPAVGALPPAGSAAPSPGAAGTPPPDVSRPADSPDGARPNGVVPAPEFPVPGPPAAVPDELSSPEHRRYQQLRVETLRLMIAAARRALPIAPFQQRIDAASRTALQDVSEAADRMEETAADLRAALAADPAGR